MSQACCKLGVCGKVVPCKSAFTVLLERFSFNREIFTWAPGEQANNPKVLVSAQLLNNRSSIFDILCLTLRQVFDKM